ncbi:MAG: hypothetical protein U1D55_15570 [Phycisphaerae bacterium]
MLNSDGATPEVIVNGAMGAGGAVVVDYDGWNPLDDWIFGATVKIGSTVYGGNSPAAHLWEITSCRGDMNNDGDVNTLDYVPFGLALVDPAAYAAQYPGLDGSRVYHGDCNCDGVFNAADTNRLVELVAGLCCTVTPDCLALECDDVPALLELGPQRVAAMLGETPARRIVALRILDDVIAAQNTAALAGFWSDVRTLLVP